MLTQLNYTLCAVWDGIKILQHHIVCVEGIITKILVAFGSTWRNVGTNSFSPKKTTFFYTMVIKLFLPIKFSIVHTYFSYLSKISSHCYVNAFPHLWKSFLSEQDVNLGFIISLLISYLTKNKNIPHTQGSIKGLMAAILTANKSHGAKGVAKANS